MMYLSLQLWNLASVFLWYRFLSNKLHYVIDKNSVHGLWGFFFAGVVSTFTIETLHTIYPLPIFVQSIYESDILYSVLVTGVIEEFAKWMAFILIAHYVGTVKEPQDGVLQGAAVGLGFAFVENILYIDMYPELFIAVRPILSTGGHILYGAVWGGLYSAARWSNVSTRDPGAYRVAFFGLFSMACVHGLYNSVVVYGLFFGIIVDSVVLYFSFVLFMHLTKHSPYRNYPLSQAKLAIQGIRRGLFFNPKSPILNDRMATYLMFLGEYRRAIQYFNYAIPRAGQKDRIRFLAAVCECAFLKNEKGRQRIIKTWGRLSDSDRKKSRGQIERILARNKALLHNVEQVIDSPFSVRRGKQGYALSKDLKTRRINRKYRRSEAIEEAVQTLSDEEKRTLRRKLGL